MNFKWLREFMGFKGILGGLKGYKGILRDFKGIFWTLWDVKEF